MELVNEHEITLTRGEIIEAFKLLIDLKHPEFLKDRPGRYLWAISHPEMELDRWSMDDDEDTEVCVTLEWRPEH